jgi:uncharacterized membrane protein
VTEPAETSPTESRRTWLSLRFGGLVGALIMFALSMTPSLLPRPWTFQALVSGVAMLIGYGVAALAVWGVGSIWRVPPSPAWARRGWLTLAILAPIVLIAATLAGRSWQNEVRVLVGEPPHAEIHLVLILLIAVAVFLVGLLVARALRWITRRLNGLLARIVPRPVAMTVGVIVVSLGSYYLVTGLAFDAGITFADSVYSKENEGTPENATQPTSSLRSGGSGSAVAWESLGYQGRAFVGEGPDAAAISALTGEPAIDPIRVYAGIDTADTIDERARIAVQELERTGGFDREVLVVASATGTGWLSPAATTSIEYLWGGDTAIASIQYSYLPSWLSFLVDKERAADAGSALFDQVYARWSELPEESRPRLIAYGLSLGSFASQSAFASTTDMAARTDGALFLGSPSFSEPHGQLEADRDPGSPQWRPIYQGGQVVRFGPSNEDLAGAGAPWRFPRVVYLQHANDPVVWWDPELILERPDWLEETPGPDRSPDMVWIPGVTFVQVTIDQFFGTSVPDLQGHNYEGTMVGAWQTVVPAPGWSPTELAELEQIVDELPHN